VNDARDPNFTNCNQGTAAPANAPAPPPNAELFNDGTLIVKTFGETGWWRGRTMRVSVRQSNGTWKSSEAHRFDIHRKIDGENSWPVCFVVYQDGNVRMKPQAKIGKGDPVFGSSIIIGAAAQASRPFVDIKEVLIDPRYSSIQLLYTTGTPATMTFSVNRTYAKLVVNFTPSAGRTFATLRSMFVADDNCDVGRIRFGSNDEHVLARVNSTNKQLPGSVFNFYRKVVSTKHNTSAPDFQVRVLR
jgi:hypothetical protein